jgi:hypothetical protein
VIGNRVGDGNHLDDFGTKFSFAELEGWCRIVRFERWMATGDWDDTDDTRFLSFYYAKITT